MSVDLFVYRKDSEITADELRRACGSVALRFPGVLIDTTWDAMDSGAFPPSEALFWQVERATVGLAAPPDAEVFEVEDDQSAGRFAYAHLWTNSRNFDFLDFLARALATELDATTFDPQLGSILPVELPPIDRLRERHDAEIRQYKPVLKKEYWWLLDGEYSVSEDERFKVSAAKFNGHFTASVRKILDQSFSELKITRLTSSDLSDGLTLLAGFDSDGKVRVLLTGELQRTELFDRFANDLAARLGKAFQSRLKYVFS